MWASKLKNIENLGLLCYPATKYCVIQINNWPFAGIRWWLLTCQIIKPKKLWKQNFQQVSVQQTPCVSNITPTLEIGKLHNLPNYFVKQMLYFNT